jgi:hypothetical protein
LYALHVWHQNHDSSSVEVAAQFQKNNTDSQRENSLRSNPSDHAAAS